MVSLAEDIRRYQDLPRDLQAAVDLVDAYDVARVAQDALDGYRARPASSYSSARLKKLYQVSKAAWEDLDDAYERWCVLR